jgi:hypothetical protein
VDNIHCHHKTPRALGGSDNYENLLLVSKNVHILIHAKNGDIIKKYMGLVNLTKQQLDKLNKYRKILNLEEV